MGFEIIGLAKLVTVVVESVDQSVGEIGIQRKYVKTTLKEIYRSRLYSYISADITRLEIVEYGFYRYCKSSMSCLDF
jgi:hypothetical protein